MAGRKGGSFSAFSEQNLGAVLTDKQTYTRNTENENPKYVRIARKKQKKGGKSTFEEVVPLQMERERESGERRGG